ncbi:mitogen-activated protein kinase kinase kinase 1, partial [Striga asiatica]
PEPPQEQYQLEPRRLDRSYAFKDVDYELSPSASASASPHARAESGGQMSFRINGTEGEFEFICQTYGFSGIDDFAISPEEFDAMKGSPMSAPLILIVMPLVVALRRLM